MGKHRGSRCLGTAFARTLPAPVNNSLSERDGEKERECLCVCVCVCVRQTYRQRQRDGERQRYTVRLSGVVTVAQVCLCGSEMIQSASIPLRFAKMNGTMYGSSAAARMYQPPNAVREREREGGEGERERETARHPMLPLHELLIGAAHRRRSPRVRFPAHHEDTWAAS